LTEKFCKKLFEKSEMRRGETPIKRVNVRSDLKNRRFSASHLLAFFLKLDFPNSFLKSSLSLRLCVFRVKKIK